MKKSIFFLSCLLISLFACNQIEQQETPKTNSTQASPEFMVAPNTYIISSLSPDQSSRIEMTISIDENNDAFISKEFFPASPEGEQAFALLGRDLDYEFVEESLIHYTSNIPGVGFQEIYFDYGNEVQTIANASPNEVTITCTCTYDPKTTVSGNFAIVTCSGMKDNCRCSVSKTQTGGGGSSGIGSAIVQANSVTFLN